MSRDLDDLKAALRAAPAPDASARDQALQLAMENFDRLQGSADPARLNIDRPKEGRGVVNGAFQMLKKLATRPVLAATTSAAALLAGMVIVLPLIDRSTPPGTAPKPAVVQAADETLQRSEEAAANESELLAPPPVPAPMAMAAPAGSAMTDMAAPESDAMMEPVMEPMAAVAPDTQAQPVPNTEAFSNAPANPVKVTAEDPVSTFSIDVDTASYAMVRQSLNAGFLPDPASVRVEEMVNYFPYAYPAPAPGEAFRPTVTVMPTPWNPGTRLVHIGIQGALPEVDARPPLNLVFLVDTSGSMDDPMKLPLLKQSLALVLPQLRPEDQVAIVTYAGSAGQVLPPTPASDRATIMAALDRLAAGGSTAGAEGIALAYQVAQSMTSKDEVSRVILATDGDFNVGIDDPEALKGFIAEQRKVGVYLSILGFGRGNLDDATMQALAQNGNGMAA